MQAVEREHRVGVHEPQRGDLDGRRVRASATRETRICAAPPSPGATRPARPSRATRSARRPRCARCWRPPGPRRRPRRRPAAGRRGGHRQPGAVGRDGQLQTRPSCPAAKRRVGALPSAGPTSIASSPSASVIQATAHRARRRRPGRGPGQPGPHARGAGQRRRRSVAGVSQCTVPRISTALARPVAVGREVAELVPGARRPRLPAGPRARPARRRAGAAARPGRRAARDRRAPARRSGCRRCARSPGVRIAVVAVPAQVVPSGRSE